MHACVSRSAPNLDSRAQLGVRRNLVSPDASNYSKRISDLLVGVEHDSKLAAHSSGRKVLLEDSAHNTALSVGSSDLAPHALVLQAGLGRVLPENVCDALAVVEAARLAVLAALDVDESSVLSLRPLASLESHEDGLGVKSAQAKRDG